MSKNIKEIGKELLGKSLNSYHRRTGLTQLEENNKMQDGILNGILSQVDNAYIEKTEQSNIMHLDGSGDGVVVVDSIEGNTMVNCISTNIDTNIKFTANGVAKRFEYKVVCKGNATYTLVTNITKNTINHNLGLIGWHIETNNRQIIVPNGFVGLFKQSFTTKADIGENWYMDFWKENTEGEIEFNNFMVLEGDWTNREIPSYFEGMKSSFEEKVNDEGKYEIEILSNNRNLINTKRTFPYTVTSTVNNGKNVGVVKCKPNTQYVLTLKTNHIKGHVTCVCSPFEYSETLLNANNCQSEIYNKNKAYYGTTKFEFQASGINTITKITTPHNAKYMYINSDYRYAEDFVINEVQLEHGEKSSNYTKQKQNKIKLLLNEPLRAVDDMKDTLEVIDGALKVKRKICEYILDDDFIQQAPILTDSTDADAIVLKLPNKIYDMHRVISDRYAMVNNGGVNSSNINTYYVNPANVVYVYTKGTTRQQFKDRLVGTKMIYVLDTPIYEEVLNEYGEPIILEGYENGTIYIDSTIVPTTTIRYTPKMESMRVAKEVNNNNIMLTDDINESIIPYMMEVDMMIMEKEMALSSQINIRKIGEKIMTSMQKRTQDMLERLIKGKSLTKEDAKTRVTVYLNAGKITDAQAEELMLLIEEVYNV